MAEKPPQEDTSMMNNFQVAESSNQNGDQDDGKKCRGSCRIYLPVVIILTIGLLLARLSFLGLFTAVFIDCLGNFSTTSTCETFDRIPNRQVFEPLLPITSIITSVIWLIVLQRLHTNDRKLTYRHTFEKLLKKLYFWKYVFMIAIVIVYHYTVFIQTVGLPGSYVYIFFPIEEIFSAVLMFVTNFRGSPRPPFVDKKKRKRFRRIYKGVLAVTAIENTVIAMITTVYLSLKVLTLPSEFTGRHNVYQAINLTFFAVNAHYRFSIAHYFLAKVFLKNMSYRILTDVGDKKLSCEEASCQCNLTPSS